MEPTSLVAFGSALGLSPAAGKLIERAFGPAADVIGEVMREKANSRRNRVIERAAAQLQKANIEPREVPLRLLAPILQHAALEDDEVLTEKWAALLANAASDAKGGGVSTRFAQILSVMSPPEARVLDLFANPEKTRSKIADANTESVLSAAADGRDNMYYVVSSLQSHGLLQRIGRERMPGGGWSTRLGGGDRYELSPVGIAFLKACAYPGEPLPHELGSFKLELG